MKSGEWEWEWGRRQSQQAGVQAARMPGMGSNTHIRI